MADSDDWRAERAAQLAGTPFARPAIAPRSDDTLPIQTRAVPPVNKTTKIAPAPRVASSNGSMRRNLTITGTLAAAAVAIGLGVFELRQGNGAESTSVAVSSVKVTDRVQSTPLPATPAPAPILPSTPPVVANPTVDVAPPLTHENVGAAVPAKARHSSHSTKVADSSATDHKARSSRKSPRVRAKPHAETARPAPVPRASTASEAPTEAIVKLPVCQPNVYSRPARPCRPSRSRQVREPFYNN